jgi:hypothetical protein
MYKETLFLSTQVFTKKYGDIFLSLYLYEYSQNYNTIYPQQCDDKSENIIKFVLSNYFQELLENDYDFNIELICPIMLFDLLELYDY